MRYVLLSSSAVRLLAAFDMYQYTTAEMTDMVLAYGKADCNGRAAARLYAERFPNRHTPHHSSFAAIERRLREAGKFHVPKRDAGRPRSTRTPQFEEDVLRLVEENPSTSTRQVAQTLHTSQNAVWQVVHDQQLHPYHLQKVHALLEEDYPRRVQFAEWYLQQCILQPQFSSLVLFTDECTFTRNGILNLHNMHVWADENPCAQVVQSHQHRFSINVWAGIIADHIIGPYLLPNRLTGEIYLTFLRDMLPTLLDAVPLEIRQVMWLQHDGAPAHFDRNVRNHLNVTYPNRWIGRGGPVPWPARSPDLTPLDYFLWGSMKALVYATPVTSEEDLIARVHGAIEILSRQPHLLDHVRAAQRRRCRLCIDVGGTQFEPRL